jgi:dephospho-CoA kinase
MTKIIGLTGGIGMGKLRLQIIFNLGDSVYIADDEARKIMQTATYNAIKETFGEHF